MRAKPPSSSDRNTMTAWPSCGQSVGCRTQRAGLAVKHGQQCGGTSRNGGFKARSKRFVFYARHHRNLAPIGCARCHRLSSEVALRLEKYEGFIGRFGRSVIDHRQCYPNEQNYRIAQHTPAPSLAIDPVNRCTMQLPVHRSMLPWRCASRRSTNSQGSSTLEARLEIIVANARMAVRCIARLLEQRQDV